MRERKLASSHQIISFALVWAEMYRHHRTIPGYFFEEQMFVGDGLEALGFVMDCGQSLAKKFPNLCTYDVKSWKQVFKEIDLRTLGNAIFSQWRYFNHWDCTPMSESDYQWFVMAFTRLAKLAELAERQENGQ